MAHVSTVGREVGFISICGSGSLYLGVQVTSVDGSKFYGPTKPWG